MAWWMVILALGLPALAATLWLRLLCKQRRPGDWPALIGFGYVLGSIAAASLLGLYGQLGLGLSVWPLLALTGLLTFVAAALLWRCQRRLDQAFHVSSSAPLPLWQKLVVLALLLWLAARFSALAQEIWWRPLYPWDAWTTWGLRARTWTELRELIPFVPPTAWLGDSGGSSQTIHAWHYPKAVSLISTWSSLSFGAWNETAANLPWIGCAVALGLGFYGQTRRWGASALTALVFVWLLLSLPILDTHIALAGYADLWLATALGFAFMSFLFWARDGDQRQLVVAGLFVGIVPLIKVEGLIWALLFVPAFFAARPRYLRWLLMAVALGVVIVGAALLLANGSAIQQSNPGSLASGGAQIDLPYLGTWRLHYTDTWQVLREHFLFLDNWHLLGYMLLFVLAWRLWQLARKTSAAWQRAGDAWVISALSAYFVLFFWTDAARWATQATSVNRVFLHFVPALLFWAMATWMETVQDKSSEVTAKHER